MKLYFYNLCYVMGLQSIQGNLVQELEVVVAAFSFIVYTE